MKLFDEYERTYVGYRDEDESFYAYLNRTGHCKFAPARQMLEEWFAAYPQAHQATLASNFTSSNYGPHLGAFFELYVFSLLRACHFEVRVEQVVDPEKGNPIDFVVGPLENPSFCVESTVIADSEQTVRNRQLLNTLTERLNRIPSNRQLILEVVSTSEQSLSTSEQSLLYAEVSMSVEQWLRSLDTDVATSDSDAEYDTEPSHVWAGYGWQLLFRVLPGARVDDLIPMQSEAAWEGSMSRLKKTLQDKAKQHKGVQIPYIIAVDVVSDEAMFRSDDSIRADLFGKEIILYDRNADKVIEVRRSPELPRRSDREKGLWFGRSGPRNQHVGAVLLVNEVMPWSVMKQTPILSHNPWAQYPISPQVWPGPQMLATDETTGAYKRQDGKTIAEIFGQGQ